MKRRWVILLALLLAGGGLLLWWGISRNLWNAPTQATGTSMKAGGQPSSVDLMALLSQGGLEYTVQPGDSLFRIARKQETTIELIKKLNGLEGDLIHIGQRLKLLQGRLDVIVSKSENRLELRLGGKTIKSYWVSTGEKNSTPTGDFTIVNRLENPTWYKTGAVIPPGSPDNILGSRWLGITSKEYPKGYGIHGTSEPDKIGQAVTAGCVRMKNEEVEELYTLLPEGTSVKIVDRMDPLNSTKGSQT